MAEAYWKAGDKQASLNCYDEALFLVRLVHVCMSVKYNFFYFPLSAHMTRAATCGFDADFHSHDDLLFFPLQAKGDSELEGMICIGKGFALMSTGDFDEAQGTVSFLFFS
jgi:hypothetical protein